MKKIFRVASLSAKSLIVPTEERKRANDVYDWSAFLTAESRPSIRDFYETKAFKELYLALERANRGLFGIIGLQGTGKSMTLGVLSAKLYSEKEDYVYLKWSRNWMENLIDSTQLSMDVYAKSLKVRAEEVYERKFNRYMPGDFLMEAQEALIGKAEVKQLEEDAVFYALWKAWYVFIDMPDYSKTDKKLMTYDLDALQKLWNTVMEKQTSKTTFVVALQKELFKGHFLFGKMRVFEVKPLTAFELVDAYKQKWNTTEPFTEEALLHIAVLSRGIFRRFLKYITLTLGKNIVDNESLPISLETVNATITLDELVKDMDLELSDVFHSKEQKVQAVKLIVLLQQKQELNQKEIAEFLGINDMNVSRLLSKLDAYDYIQRKRGTKKEFIISLK